MLNSKLATLFLLLSISLCHDFPSEEGVLVLTDETFSHALEHHPTMLVEFYAPWCGHCKTLAPEYAKAAQTLEKSDLQVKLAKVDATVNKAVAEKFEVKGFPTLVFFKNGVQSEYTGGRTEQTIVNWIKKKVGAQSELVSSAQQVEDLKSKGVVVVYIGEENKNFQNFLLTADKFDDVTFLHSFNSDLKSELNASELTLFKPFDEKVNHYAGDFSPETLVEFVETNSIPTIMGFDQKAAEVIFQNQKTALFHLLGSDKSQNEQAQKEFERASGSLKGKIVMSETQVESGFGQRLGEFVGVKSEDGPLCMIVAFQDENIQKFRLEGPVTTENVLKFFEDYKSGSLKATLKSEEIPATQSENVYVLVGKSFPSVVYDETKDVLVEFYAPWCGHCKSLAPKYEELATQLKSNKNILIAKIDSTMNEVEGVSIKGFPTIKLFRRGQKQQPIDYNGEREVADFVKFLKEQTEWEETQAEQKEQRNEDL